MELTLTIYTLGVIITSCVWKRVTAPSVRVRVSVLSTGGLSMTAL